MNQCGSCKTCKQPCHIKGGKPDLTIALAGNANVGKSVIFNQLTGLEQTIGNWPGKTVERAEGLLVHHNKTIRVIDLPGIYSLSTYSMEEMVSREYIAKGEPDVVVNVLDSTSLERNLFFTMQLLEMNAPLVIALNQMDIARKKGLKIDVRKLQARLGVPVIATVAVKGKGVHEVVDASLGLEQKKKAGKTKASSIRYGLEVETRIEKLIKKLEGHKLGYPSRWLAIKLLEDDREITKLVGDEHPKMVQIASELASEITQMHGEDCSVVITSERYAVASRIANEVQTLTSPKKASFGESFDRIGLHPVWGYVVSFFILVGILAVISLFGDFVIGAIEGAFESANPGATDFWSQIFWNGGVVGFYGAISVALGFILPLFLIIGVLEDSGYLPRIAFLMDRPLHSIGLHGKACMPMMLGLGCSVPAVLGSRIMETRRDRFITAFLATMVPCSARMVVVLGLVGAFMGVTWAIGLLFFEFAIIAVVGRALNRFLPGRPVGLIMEMPKYKRPVPGVVLAQAWSRIREFIVMAVPLIIIGSLLIEGMALMGLLQPFSDMFSPITVAWLGLPAFTGILFIFGVLRKEAALILLATVAGTTNFSTVLTPIQMLVFSIVLLLYIPCVATIAALRQEFGMKSALAITIGEIGLATVIGGLAYRILDVFM